MSRLRFDEGAIAPTIDRWYSEGEPFQWAIETYRNSRQVGASEIHFTVEQQAAEAVGVLRRLILDNGPSMDPEEMVGYFGLLGRSSKSISGPHDAHGIGAKVSLLPWNPHGVVIVCKWDPEVPPAMIWMYRNGDHYELREWSVEDPETGRSVPMNVVEAYDGRDLEGEWCNWSALIPDDYGTGTAIVLLGDEPKAHTAFGDPERSEEDLRNNVRYLHQYLNRRVARVPDGVSVRVSILEDLSGRSAESAKSRTRLCSWPTGEDWGMYSVNVRGLLGILEWRDEQDRVEDHGTVALDDDVEVDWWLLAPSPEKARGRTVLGDDIGEAKFLFVLYPSDLDDAEAYVQRAVSEARFWGINNRQVARRVVLVVRPPLYDSKTKIGVQPESARAGLRWGLHGDLPLSDWGYQFQEELPKPIQKVIMEAMAEAGDGLSQDRKDRMKRLAERFGSAWRSIRYAITTDKPTESAGSATSGIQFHAPTDWTRKTKGKGGGGSGGTRGSSEESSHGGAGAPNATKRSSGVGLPEPLWQPVDQFSADPQWAAYYDDPTHIIYLNRDHPLFVAERRRWLDQYSRNEAQDEIVEDTVREVYEDLIVAHVAHARHFRGAEVGDGSKIGSDHWREMTSPAALTMAVMGLFPAESDIKTRLGGRIGRQKAAS
jgi:hypothetical protein